MGERTNAFLEESKRRPGTMVAGSATAGAAIATAIPLVFGYMQEGHDAAQESCEAHLATLTEELDRCRAEHSVCFNQVLSRSGRPASLPADQPGDEDGPVDVR